LLTSSFNIKVLLPIVFLLALSCNTTGAGERQKPIVQKESTATKNDWKKESSSAIRVNLESKGFYSDAWQDYLVFTFNLYNQSDKDVRALKGMVRFYNAFGEEVYQVELSCEREIASRKQLSEEVRVNFRPYLEKDVALKDRSVEGLKTQWLPEQIIFTDNSTISFNNK
jgi:hypothetical protein